MPTGPIPGVHKNRLPGRLGDAGDFPGQRPLTQANTTHVELAKESAGTAAQWASIVLTHLELQLPLRLSNF